jgi:hypothetical protein
LATAGEAKAAISPATKPIRSNAFTVRTIVAWSRCGRTAHNYRVSKRFYAAIVACSSTGRSELDPLCHFLLTINR